MNMQYAQAVVAHEAAQAGRSSAAVRSPSRTRPHQVPRYSLRLSASSPATIVNRPLTISVNTA
jgi:hypothetical protein